MKCRSAGGWSTIRNPRSEGCPLSDPADDLDDVVDVALGVRAARDRQPDEVHRGRRLRAVRAPPEHHGPDLAAPDAALAVERDGERLAGILERRNVRQQRAGVEVDRVAAERLDERHARPIERLAEVLGRTDAVSEVVLVDDLAEPLGDRLEVAAGQTAVGREALGQDQQVPALLGEGVVVEREPAADVREPILLRRHGHPVGQRGHLADDVRDRAVFLAGLTELDEPGVLGESAGVEEEGHAVAITGGAHGAQVLERDGLPAAGVVRDRDEHDGNIVATLREQPLERLHVHVALERVLVRGVAALRDHEVDRLGAGELDVGPGRVEMGVVREPRDPGGRGR